MTHRHIGLLIMLALDLLAARCQCATAKESLAARALPRGS